MNLAERYYIHTATRVSISKQLAGKYRDTCTSIEHLRDVNCMLHGAVCVIALSDTAAVWHLTLLLAITSQSFWVSVLLRHTHGIFLSEPRTDLQFNQLDDKQLILVYQLAWKLFDLCYLDINSQYRVSEKNRVLKI